MKKKFLSIFMAVLVTLSLMPSAVFASNNVAEVDGQQYLTLSDAISNAKEGSTITLLGDTTENITVGKDVTIDGAGKYTISGLTTVNNGTLQNLTLKPNPSDEGGNLLRLGNTNKTAINLENVTVNYSVTKRSGASASTISGNNADITINNCHFVNQPNNNGAYENVSEWSYGLYINGQGTDGYIKITNTEFNGAFRTMIPSASGKMLIDSCTFTNSVYSVANGPTSGSQAESTVITTSRPSGHDDITITNNTFDHAGAFFFQTQVKFENNKIIFEKFMHFIQASGIIGEPVDLTNNQFILGDEAIVAVDIPEAPVVLPAGVPAVDFWVWNDTPQDKKPDDYRTYLYSYNEDGSITYNPQSDVALEQILTQTTGNKQVKENDTIKVTTDLKLPSMDFAKGRNITIEVAKGNKLELPKDLTINSNINIVGEGSVVIPEGSNVKVNSDAGLNIDGSISLFNNGNIDNDGNLTVPDKITGNGDITGNGEVAESHDMVHVSRVEPTCTEAGNVEYWYCTGCEKYFLDAEGTKEAKKEDLVLAKVNHTYKDGVCTICGQKDPNAKPAVKPESGNKPQADKTPQTGDGNNLVYPAVLLVSSLLAALLVAYKKRKA